MALPAEPEVVRADGDPDLVSSPQLADALAAVAGRPFVIVDLTRASAIDSTAIGAIVRAHVAATNVEGALVVVAPNENLARILSVAGVTRLARVVDTLDAARDYLTERAG